jgi:hypothetical protein
MHKNNQKLIILLKLNFNELINMEKIYRKLNTFGIHFLHLYALLIILNKKTYYV